MPSSMASSSAASSAGGAATTTDAKTATSAAALGGMDALVAAANKEGALNVIALPPDWANYAEVIAAFQKKYPGIKLEQQNPNASSADEISAAATNAGTKAAPDVFDLGTAVTLASTDKFAPYKVAAWADIPTDSKDATGLWYNDYSGIMSVGYDASQYGELTDLAQLKDAKFKGAVALNGDPTKAGAAYNGVVFASLANGGSLDDLSKGIDYFKGIAQAGNLYKGDATPSTVQSGEVGVLFDWSYNQPGYKTAVNKQGGDWKVFIPKGAVLGAYYNQAINKDAPHPAAARLWEEFLYSADAQNLWLKGGAKPILQEALTKAGTINKSYLANVPTSEDPVGQTAAQVTAGGKYIAANWPKVIG